MNTSNILPSLEKFSNTRCLVVGDLMLDHWLWGSVSRISPEAPVPVVAIERSTYTPGGAANVVHNLQTLGAQVKVAGVCGTDSSGDTLLKLLEDSEANTSGIVRIPTKKTIQKSRIVAHNQQVVRADFEDQEPLSEESTQALLDAIVQATKDVDLVILSDYNKGVFTPTFCHSWINQVSAPIFVGPKPENIDCFQGVQALSLNAKEAFEATGVPITSTEQAVKAGHILLKRTASQEMLITRGSDGMTVVTRDGFDHKPALATEVYDVSGAGDTVLSSYALSRQAGLSPKDAIEVASQAAAIVVRKLGTACVYLEEIQNSVSN